MMIGITHLHSTLRYAIVLVLIMTLVRAFLDKNGQKPFSKGLDRLTLISMILLHIQLLFGFVLYFMSGKVLLSDMGLAMKSPVLRFFTVEHALGMVIAITLITVGRVKLKKLATDAEKFKTVLFYFGLGSLILFLSIPWPFLKEFGTWF